VTAGEQRHRDLIDHVVWPTMIFRSPRGFACGSQRRDRRPRRCQVLKLGS
jgi:hypothetical protein